MIKSEKVDFFYFMISFINWHIWRMQSIQFRYNINASTSDNSTKNVERISKFAVKTKLPYAGTDPLFEDLWKEF